jgi:hypothetical protein
VTPKETEQSCVDEQVRITPSSDQSTFLRKIVVGASCTIALVLIFCAAFFTLHQIASIASYQSILADLNWLLFLIFIASFPFGKEFRIPKGGLVRRRMLRIAVFISIPASLMTYSVIIFMIIQNTHHSNVDPSAILFLLTIRLLVGIRPIAVLILIGWIASLASFVA